MHESSLKYFREATIFWNGFFSLCSSKLRTCCQCKTLNFEKKMLKILKSKICCQKKPIENIITVFIINNLMKLQFFVLGVQNRSILTCYMSKKDFKLTEFSEMSKKLTIFKLISQKNKFKNSRTANEAYFVTTRTKQETCLKPRTMEPFIGND